MSLQDPSSNRPGPARRLVDAGGDLTGAALGATAGALLIGPEAAIGGAVAGSLLKSSISEFAGRILGRREEKRVGAAWTFAVSSINRRIENGETLRDDGFFSDNGDGSDAEEILEAVLLAAQREHEEKKVRHLSLMFTNLAFTENLNRGVANWAVKTAEQLSWNQYCLLAIIAQSDLFELPSVEVGGGATGWNSWAINQELAELGWGQRELVGAQRRAEELDMSIPVILIDQQMVTQGGRLLVEILQLRDIDYSELEAVARLLSSEC